MSETGKRIKQRRKELGLSADKLAEDLGVSRSTIFRYEKGDIEKVPAESLQKIADTLQISPAYLMGWYDSCDKTIDEYNSHESDMLNLLEKNGYSYVILGDRVQNIHIRRDDFQCNYVLSELVARYIKLISGKNIINQLLLAPSNEENLLQIEDILMRLNDKGQKEAIKQVENLTYNPKYTNNENLITIKENTYAVIAAHNDNENPEQLEKMQRDAIRLKEEAAKRRAKRNE